jgi:hypothetical protein
MKKLLSYHLKYLILILLVAGAFQSLKAGWILTGKYIDKDGNTALQRFFIQDQKVKFEQYNIIYTLNFATNEVILVDPVNLLYYKGTLQSYVMGMKNYKNRQLSLLMNEIPKDQQGDYKKEYELSIEEIGREIIPDKDSVVILRLVDSLKIIGQPSEKYQVSVNSRKIEEVWISPGLDVSKQFSWKKYLYFLSIVEPENTTFNYMITSPFMQLLDKGFPTRRIMIRNGYRTEFQINKMEEKGIPDYEFYTPSLCKELTFDEWIDRSKSKESLNDDYE